jgi:hypothetical protein
MVFRGLEGAEILDNECTGTSGISIVSGPERYLEDPGCSRAAGTWSECQNSSRAVALRRTTIRDTRSSSPLWIGAFLRDVLVEDLTIEGPNTAPCVRAVGPVRGLALHDVSLRDCPQAGIRLGEAGVPGTWGASDPEESVELVDVEILDADAALLDGARSHAVHLAQGCVGCRIENLRVTGWTRSGVFVEPGYALRDADFETLTLDQLGSWHAGSVAVSQLPSCNAGRAGVAYTVGGVASTTSCAAGPAGASNLCVCDGAAWRDADQFGATAATSPGIDLRGASEVSGNLFSGITCTDVRRRGHCIEAPASAFDNVFTGLLARDDRGLAALDAKLEEANDGVLNLRGASANDVGDASCENLRSGHAAGASPCVCLDASC